MADFKEDFLRLDGTKLSYLHLVLCVLVILVFVLWSLHIRELFSEGYRDGIKDCFSIEYFVNMTEKGKSLYGNYYNISGNVTEMMMFLKDIEKIRQSYPQDT